MPVRKHETNGRLAVDCKSPVPGKINRVAGLIDDLPALAREPDLIAAIQRDIAGMGLVGEDDNGLLTYLIFTSRMLSSPGAIVARGKSSGGKTTVLARVAKLFPDESKIDAMTMTPASLFNTSEDYLKNKIILSGERRHSQDDDARDATALLRQLLSEKRITRGVSVYDKEAQKWSTKYVVREGPVAYAESTTASSIFEEDLNRMLQVYVDASESQTRAVMRAIASRYDPARPKSDPAEIVERHHEFQRWLKTCDVRIPFWKPLAEEMPAVKLESRRVIQQVLTVIEAAVVLQQAQREEQDGYRLATLDDYELARRLLLPPLHASVGVGKEYKNAERLKLKVTKPIFTANDVQTALDYKSKMGASHFLKSLVEAKLLERLTEAQGSKPATYRWNEEAESSLIVLPPVESLRERALG